MFSRIVFLFAVVQVSPVVAFAPLQYRTKTFGRSSQLHAVEDLEAKLLGESTKPVVTKAKPAVKETKSAAAVKTSTQSELSLLKSEMPQYESTTATAASTPKAKPEKPKPIPKPKPAPVPKAVQPAPAPKVEKPKPVPKPKPVVVEKPKAVVVEKPKPVAKQVKKPLPPPPKPQPAASGDFQTIAAGVALGGAPLALGALGALAAVRGALAGTAARREKIQEQIAAREEQKKLAAQQDVDFEGVVTAGIFLGAAGASLALIIANPFGSNEGVEFSLPISLPTISLPSGGSSTPVVSETKPASATDLARAKIRAEQIARLEEKRAINEAKRAELAKKSPPPRATTVKKTTPEVVKEVDSYDALFKKAASAGPQSSAATKEAKIVKEAKAPVSAATLADTDAKAALDEAKSLTGSKAAPAPVPPAPKEDTVAAIKAAAEKVAQEAKVKAEAEAAAAAKQFAVDEENAAKAVKAALETEKKMIAAEKAAIAAKEAEAVKKAAEVDVAAKEAAEVAKATAKADAKAEAVASQKVAETTNAVTSSPDAPSGGRVLPKEEISAETMAFLKTLKK